MNLLDVFRYTFLEFLLQARKSISEVLIYGRNIHKFFRMIGYPPGVKILSGIISEFESKESKSVLAVNMPS